MALFSRLVFVGLLCSCIGTLHAQSGMAGAVVQVDTRPGVTVPVFELWNNNAVATVVLFSGGGGGYGKIGADGWPSSKNFLIRTGKLWAAHAFNIVMVGRPSDGIDLQDGAVRIGDEHGADNVAIFKAIKRKSPLPIWVVGTSMGTISATAAAIRDTDKLLAGVVLTSSVTAYRVRGAVPSQELASIRVPVLVVHHARDACKVCTPYEAKNITGALTNAPVKEMLVIEAGSGASGDPCEPMHYHGYIGAEQEVVDMIAAWIAKTRQALAPQMIVTPVKAAFLGACRSEALLQELQGHLSAGEKSESRKMLENQDCMQLAGQDMFRVLKVHGSLVEIVSFFSRSATGYWTDMESVRPVR